MSSPGACDVRFMVPLMSHLLADAVISSRQWRGSPQLPSQNQTAEISCHGYAHGRSMLVWISSFPTAASCGYGFYFWYKRLERGTFQLLTTTNNEARQVFSKRFRLLTCGFGSRMTSKTGRVSGRSMHAVSFVPVNRIRRCQSR